MEEYPSGSRYSSKEISESLMPKLDWRPGGEPAVKKPRARMRVQSPTECVHALEFPHASVTLCGISIALTEQLWQKLSLEDLVTCGRCQKALDATWWFK